MAGNRIKETLLNEALNQAPIGCPGDTLMSTTLVEELRAERARVSKKLSARVRELDQAIRLLENSDAETIVREARETLYKGD